MDGYEGFAGFEWSDGKPPPPMPDTTIVMGDFNSEPDSEEFQRMVGTFDPLYGQADHLDGFVDSWTVARERSGDDACITWVPDPPGKPAVMSGPMSRHSNHERSMACSSQFSAGGHSAF